MVSQKVVFSLTIFLMLPKKWSWYPLSHFAITMTWTLFYSFLDIEDNLPVLVPKLFVGNNKRCLGSSFFAFSPEFSKFCRICCCRGSVLPSRMFCKYWESMWTLCSDHSPRENSWRSSYSLWKLPDRATLRTSLAWENEDYVGTFYIEQDLLCVCEHISDASKEGTKTHRGFLFRKWDPEIKNNHRGIFKTKTIFSF